MIKSIGTLLILLTSIIGYSQSKIVGKVLDEEIPIAKKLRAHIKID